MITSQTLMMRDEKDKILPKEYQAPTLHRITVSSKVFDLLELIRSKNHLYDREAAIIWMMDKLNYWVDDEDTKKN